MTLGDLVSLTGKVGARGGEAVEGGGGSSGVPLLQMVPPEGRTNGGMNLLAEESDPEHSLVHSTRV